MGTVLRNAGALDPVPQKALLLDRRMVSTRHEENQGHGTKDPGYNKAETASTNLKIFLLVDGKRRNTAVGTPTQAMSSCGCRCLKSARQPG
mmetsp:Transcript_12086/g.50252  ORF Transcript_12086/g.50252 Transcript_12086/m.50252 type:complete len:91 (-) Transcript_12086:537-809(-)